MSTADSLYKSAGAYQDMMDSYDKSLTAWPMPYKTRFVETRHGRTHVIVCGREDAPPLMIFHGWAANSSATYLEYDLVRLGQSFRLYLPDTIGQTGRSAPNRPSKDGAPYSEWTSDVINALELESLYLMGISGGGYLCLKAASVLGARVWGVVAISTAGLIPLHITTPRFLVGGMLLTMWPTPRTGMVFVKAMLTPNRTILPVHEEMARGMMMVFKTHRFQSGPTPLTDEELRRITAPLTILLAADDVFVDSPKAAARAKAILPHAQIEIVPQCGHMLTIDRPGLAEERLMTLLID